MNSYRYRLLVPFLVGLVVHGVADAKVVKRFLQVSDSIVPVEIVLQDDPAQSKFKILHSQEYRGEIIATLSDGTVLARLSGNRARIVRMASARDGVAKELRGLADLIKISSRNIDVYELSRGQIGLAWIEDRQAVHYLCYDILNREKCSEKISYRYESPLVLFDDNTLQYKKNIRLSSQRISVLQLDETESGVPVVTADFFSIDQDLPIKEIVQEVVVEEIIEPELPEVVEIAEDKNDDDEIEQVMVDPDEMCNKKSDPLNFFVSSLFESLKQCDEYVDIPVKKSVKKAPRKKEEKKPRYREVVTEKAIYKPSSGGLNRVRKGVIVGTDEIQYGSQEWHGPIYLDFGFLRKPGMEDPSPVRVMVSFKDDQYGEVFTSYREDEGVDLLTDFFLPVNRTNTDQGSLPVAWLEREQGDKVILVVFDKYNLDKRYQWKNAPDFSNGSTVFWFNKGNGQPPLVMVWDQYREGVLHVRDFQSSKEWSEQPFNEEFGVIRGIDALEGIELNSKRLGLYGVQDESGKIGIFQMVRRLQRGKISSEFIPLERIR